MSESDNLPQVEAALKAYVQKVDVATGAAAEEISLQMEGAGKREIKSVRPKGQKAVTGLPPMNRTGNLRRSIRGQSVRQGLGIYSAVVGADMVYARAVEVGNPYNPPTWTKGERFPYLEPAVMKFVKTGAIQRILSRRIGAIK